MIRLFLATLLLGLSVAAPAADKPPVIAVAANMRYAMEAIVRGFEAQGGGPVRLAFGSSGQLRQQIANGGPYELFLAADETFPQQLVAAGFTDGEGVVYARGRLALLIAPGAAVRPDAALSDIVPALDDGRLTRFAIANPDTAPYGKAAREALMQLDVWTRLAPVLVQGESIAQAAQFVASGNAQAGVVAYGQVKGPELAGTAMFALIPADAHAPLDQRMVVLKGAGPVARALYAYLQGPDSARVLEAFGYEVPPR